jgi:predicted nucleic acid-binding protein
MARMREIVLDSSVVVKWFSAETKSGEALKLRFLHTRNSRINNLGNSNLRDWQCLKV